MSHPMLHAAAESFDVHAHPGAATDSRVGCKSLAVYSPLRVTVLLFADGQKRLCLVCAPVYCDSFPFTNLLRKRLEETAGLKRDQVAVFSSHNHSCVMMSDTWPFPDGFPQEGVTLREDQLTAE